jgi:rubrerythrin
MPPNPKQLGPGYDRKCPVCGEKIPYNEDPDNCPRCGERFEIEE